VGHEKDAARKGREGFLQPFDRGDVQVVGGLVEEQQVGLQDERTRERDALA
jgi:hypothetical protein